MKKILVVITAIFILSNSAIVMADFKAGVVAYNAGNYSLAFEEFMIEAKKGDSGAQYNIALMYENGQGVSQNDSAAVKWYLKSAIQGSPGAQFRVGFAYDRGQGVLQSYSIATNWYGKAAEQGHVQSQINLGMLYGTGEGVLQDYVKAHKWFNIAAALGDSKSGVARDFVAMQMTPDQLAKAQKLAMEWMTKHGS